MRAGLSDPGGVDKDDLFLNQMCVCVCSEEVHVLLRCLRFVAHDVAILPHDVVQKVDFPALGRPKWLQSLI